MMTEKTEEEEYYYYCYYLEDKEAIKLSPAEIKF